MDTPPVVSPHTDATKTAQWLKLTDLRHASPAEVVIMSNQNTLLGILQNILQSQERVVLAVDKCCRRIPKPHSPIVAKRVYNKTRRVSGEISATSSEEEVDDSSRDTSKMAKDELMTTYAETTWQCFTRVIKETNCHLYVTRSKGAERSAEAFVKAFKQEAEEDVLNWLIQLSETDAVALFVTLAKKMKRELTVG